MGGFVRAFAGTVLLVLAGIGLSEPAKAASPAAVEIVWRAPATCPSQREVEAEVLSTIGSRATRKEPIHAQLDVWASEGGGWKADLELSSAGQVTKRQLSGDTCKAVASAVAVVIGVAAIDDRVPPPASPVMPTPPAPLVTAPPPPAVVVPVTPPPLPPPALPPPPLTASPPADVAPTPERSPSRGRGRPPFVFGAAALLDVGSLPVVTPGVELFAGIAPGWWRLEVVGAYLAREESGPLPSNAAFRAQLSQIDVGARACAMWAGSGASRGSRFEAGPCVTARAAWVFASGVGETVPQSGTGNLLTGAVGGRASLRLTRWLHARLQADILAPIDRPNFYIVGEGDVFRPSAVTFRGFLGLDVQL